MLGGSLLQLLLEELLLLLHPGQLLCVPGAQGVQPLGQRLQTVPLRAHRLDLSPQLLGTAEVITYTRYNPRRPRQDGL